MISDNYITPITTLVKSNTVDTGGAMSYGSSDYTTGTTFNGWINAISGSKIKYNEKNIPRSTHILFCDMSTSLTEEDRLTDGTNTYRVIFIKPLNFGNNPHLEIELLLLKDV